MCLQIYDPDATHGKTKMYYILPKIGEEVLSTVFSFARPPQSLRCMPTCIFLSAPNPIRNRETEKNNLAPYEYLLSGKKN
jgi:hypothetical protein